MSQAMEESKQEVNSDATTSSRGTDTASAPPDSLKLHRKINRYAAIFTPFMLVGAVGYATWVVVALLSGITILAIYSILFLAMVLCYARLIWTMFFDNGYVPLEPTNNHVGQYLNRSAIVHGSEKSPEGLDFFTSRPMFECDIDGLPRWCNTCKIWKPDRSHHCSQVGRCVYKMDHFCPWAGGVVCETSFKFFIQFCCYAALYCLFVLIVTAYSFTQLEDRNSFYGRNTAATIGIATVFGLFSGCLGGQSLQFASKNTTTVDNLGHANKIYSFAVRCSVDAAETDVHTTRITYPLDWKLRGNEAPPNAQTFRVWQTPVGYNPYDLGVGLENLKTTMGYSVLDWLLPIRHSPSTAFLKVKDGGEAGAQAMYKTRNAVEAIKPPTTV
ncbi:hypothetical protein FH972_025096 [Carpinus fangiana]|uniref:S-acyltransferase n=1 Tax=Carpinus fangiana TaxID=176857 RepID=A0A5N6L015_9ROSI|nr:hypothetical protein FH972_025096 [Carpinus fangiana]